MHTLEALRDAVSIPLSIKLRKGFDEGDCVAPQIAEMAQKAGFNAIFIHARTRTALYRGNCDWDLIESIAQNSDIPVMGCGDLAHGSDVLKKQEMSSCAGFALARGALMKPWIFKEIHSGKALDPTPEERFEMLSKLIRYTLEIFGEDERGLNRSRDFLCKQLDFLVRYVPSGALGRELPMQERAPQWTPRSEDEALWAQTDKDSQLELLRRAGFPQEPNPDWKPSSKDTVEGEKDFNAEENH